jgi:hypothetical protein
MMVQLLKHGNVNKMLLVCGLYNVTNNILFSLIFRSFTWIPTVHWSYAIRCQFHQRFTRSFCMRGAQKHKKDSQVINLFTLLGSVRAKTFA